MSNIDKQAVQAVADLKAGYTLGHADVVILNELARIALASLELERGMIRRFDLDMSDCDSCGQDCGADMVEDLDGEYVLWDEVLPHLYRHDEYTAPPAQVYDEDLLNMAASAIDDLLSNKDRSGAGVWADIPAKLRRAAMLQGAVQPQNQQQNIPENIPSTQFKPVADLYEISVPGGRTTTYSTDAAEASDCRVMGWGVQEYVNLERYQDAVSGNSLVIPDGWVAVPVEPTEDMIVNGFESVPDESFSDEKEWEAYDAMSGCQQAAHRAKLCWAAMLSAAPKV